MARGVEVMASSKVAVATDPFPAVEPPAPVTAAAVEAVEAVEAPVPRSLPPVAELEPVPAPVLLLATEEGSPDSLAASVALALAKVA